MEQQTQGIVSSDGNSIYIFNNSNLQSIKDDIVLSAFFIDEDEYKRIMFLIEENKINEDTKIDESKDSENSDKTNTSEVLTLAQIAVQLSQLKRQVNQISMTTPINDEATTKFYETLSSANTNSIAKIRQAA